MRWTRAGEEGIDDAGRRHAEMCSGAGKHMNRGRTRRRRGHSGHTHASGRGAGPAHKQTQATQAESRRVCGATGAAQPPRPSETPRTEHTDRAYRRSRGEGTGELWGRGRVAWRNDIHSSKRGAGAGRAAARHTAHTQAQEWEVGSRTAGALSGTARGSRCMASGTEAWVFQRFLWGRTQTPAHMFITHTHSHTTVFCSHNTSPMPLARPLPTTRVLSRVVQLLCPLAVPPCHPLP